jgi:hypothetical protein
MPAGGPGKSNRHPALERRPKMALFNVHHEEQRDYGGQVLDIVVLVGAIALFVGMIASVIMLAG